MGLWVDLVDGAFWLCGSHGHNGGWNWISLGSFEINCDSNFFANSGASTSSGV